MMPLSEPPHHVEQASGPAAEKGQQRREHRYDHLYHNLSPWPYDAGKRHISRADCVNLNNMVEEFCKT